MVEGFDNDKDELVWTKIVLINPYNIGYNSIHVVKHYKSKAKSYYLFDYILADNNGKRLREYSNSYYIKLAEMLKPDNNACFFEKNINKNEYSLITIGYLVNQAKNNTL